MAHEFSTNPIKLRVVDIKTGEWKQSYVFVGQVPPAVESQLRRLEKNINMNNPVLRKFYGPAWRDRLGVSLIQKGKKKFGGAVHKPDMIELDDTKELDTTDLDILDGANVEYKTTTNTTTKPTTGGGPETDANVEDNDVNDTEAKGDVNNVNGDEGNAEDVVDDLFDLDVMKELGDLNAEDIIERQAKESVETAEPAETAAVIADTNAVDFLTEREKTAELKHTGGVKFIIDTSVYPVDDILTFKYKIFMSIGIPIYRQHIWFKYKHKSYPVSYMINLHKNVENIDIERLVAFYTKATDISVSHSDIEGIPVELEYYKNKDFIHVTATDTFNLMQTNYYKYATDEYFLADLNDLVNPNVIYNKLGKDKYQLELIYYGFIVLYFPMITFGVFMDWLKNEKTFNQIYPELMPEKRFLRDKYEIEANITDEAYDSIGDKQVAKKLFSSITQTIVSIDNYNQDVEMLLSLRNLFDVIQLDELMTYCKAYVLYENQTVILKKSYLNEKEPKDIIPLNSLLIKIKINSDTNENMRIVIFKNGNYIIKTDWREENHMDFKNITKVVSSKVNPIITLINKMGDRIKYHNIPLMHIGSDNVIFTETSLAFYYDDDVTEARFNVFKNILEDYRTAGVILAKENISLGYEYFFRKGMYKYDPARIEKTVTIDNYYEYLSNSMIRQKWETLFERTRLFQILNISSKLKIAITGIRNDVEMQIFHMYLTGLLKIYSHNANKIKIVGDETVLAKSKRSLKNLKVQDPLLYDFKKIYKSNVVYSKICQKPYQPLILSDEEYKKLPNTKKDTAIKYWNFTKQKPVWYSCPNMKFPYIKFIVKQHPRDFCIPCCKKIEMNENVNKKKQEIHSSCMKEHLYSGEKVNLTKGSHYIASYGKNIEIGRISRLPEHTLEPLFFDTYSPEGSIDQECVTADGYYLFGVDQNTVNINSIGFLYCLVHSLGMSVVEFLAECSKRIKKSPDKFRVILDGNAGLYFTSAVELADVITTLDSDEYLLETKYENLPWNLLFMSIGYYYFGVNTILFDDQSKESIELVLPKGLKNPAEMFPDSHKNLVILRHKDKYYPIYLFNTEIFKRTGIIETKLFLNESGLIAIIRAVVRKDFEGQGSEKIKSQIDLSTIKAFALDNKLTISHYFINYSNLCYAVVLKSGDKSMYFPVNASYYSLEKNITMIFEPYDGKYDVEFTTMQKVIDQFSKWNALQSKKAGLDGIYLYPNVTIDQWIRVNKTNGKSGGADVKDGKVDDLVESDDDKEVKDSIEEKEDSSNVLGGTDSPIIGSAENPIIGFVSNNTNYFIEPMDKKKALGFHSVPVQTLLYHPFEINAMLYSVKNGKMQLTENPELAKQLEKSMYEYYLYHLLLLHFISLFNAQRNTTVRRKLLTVLSKTDFNKNLDNLREFITEIEDVEDIAKIKAIISRYMVTHHDKKQMIYDITNTYFNFDKVSLENFKNQPIKKIKEQLHKLSKQFTVIGTIKYNTFKFPNMFVACKSANQGSKSKESVGYCSGNKLIIEKNKLDVLLDVLAHDISNPSKWKWLFNSIFIEKSVDFFKFIRRKSEHITVEFVTGF